MTPYKHLIAALLCVSAFTVQAQIPVTDSVSNMQRMKEALEASAHFAKELEEMARQYKQLEAQYNSISGIRSMGDLMDNVAVRQYLPDSMNATLGVMRDVQSGDLGRQVNSIKKAAAIIDTVEYGQAGEAMGDHQNVLAMARGVSDEMFAQAGQRFARLQRLADKVNDAPDQKDILDLQAAIGAEQVMLANENLKMQAFAMSMESQRAQLAQQSVERAVLSGYGTSGDSGIPRF